METTAFVRVDLDDPAGARHYVVHAHDPKFSLELTPDDGAADRRGRGVIRRLRVPNSWAGDYNQYGRWITAAQDFFARAEKEAAASVERPRR